MRTSYSRKASFCDPAGDVRYSWRRRTRDDADERSEPSRVRIACIVAMKSCPKIILEGTRLTLKTEIAFALNEDARIVGPRKYRYHSPLISAEWCSFTNFPWGRGLINFLPEEENLALETYHTWARLFALQRYYSWIVDRFHLSTMMYQLRTYGKKHNFAWLEDRLLPLGFRLVFCKRTDDSFGRARDERLKVSGNPSQYDDLRPFIEEQKLMNQLVAESKLPTLTVDVSDNDVMNAVGSIAGWLAQTGGLHMQDSGA
jgi:hypothetical protein